MLYPLNAARQLLLASKDGIRVEQEYEANDGRFVKAITDFKPGDLALSTAFRFKKLPDGWLNGGNFYTERPTLLVILGTVELEPHQSAPQRIYAVLGNDGQGFAYQNDLTKASFSFKKWIENGGTLGY